MKQWWWGLVGITLVGGILRFWGLGQIPPSLDWDEVSMGYNAHSILRTGRDEFGKKWPMYFRALDDYKLPVYTYLTAGSIAVFGYNDWAVRLPSAATATATVALVGVLVYLLFADRFLAVAGAAMMAVSPWHLQFSRMASEVNVGLFWLTLGAVLLMVGMKRRRRWGLGWGSLSLGIASYTYLSFRVIAPVWGLGWVWIYRQSLSRASRLCLTALMIGVLVMGLGRSHVRIKGTNVFETDEAYAVFKQTEKEMFYDARLGINFTRRLLHDSKWLPTLVIIAKGYLVHWSPTFLFFDYEEKQHQTPFVGLNYLFLLPVLVAGQYYLVARGENRGVKAILWWLLLAPLPAAVTRGVPHAGRTLAMTVPLMVIAAFGWRFGVRRLPGLIKVVVVLIVGLSVGQYLHQYWVHLSQERSGTWQYGRKEMTEYVASYKGEYDRVVVSTKLEWPYIFMLYYSRYDPAAYLAQGGTKSGGWGEEGNRYDKYEFHQFRPEDLHDPKTLFVGTPDELVGRVESVQVINYLDGQPAIVIGPGRAR